MSALCRMKDRPLGLSTLKSVVPKSVFSVFICWKCEDISVAKTISMTKVRNSLRNRLGVNDWEWPEWTRLGPSVCHTYTLRDSNWSKRWTHFLASLWRRRWYDSSPELTGRCRRESYRICDATKAVEYRTDRSTHKSLTRTLRESYWLCPCVESRVLWRRLKLQILRDLKAIAVGSDRMIEFFANHFQ